MKLKLEFNKAIFLDECLKWDNLKNSEAVIGQLNGNLAIIQIISESQLNHIEKQAKLISKSILEDGLETVKTFTPILPAGTGPTCDDAKYALYDIILDLNEQNGNALWTDEATYTFAEQIISLMGINKLPDGIYEIFENYSLVIETMDTNTLNKMPEFNGY